jgi:lipoprotein NlpI
MFRFGFTAVAALQLISCAPCAVGGELPSTNAAFVQLAKLEIDFAHARKTPGLQERPSPDREVAHYGRILLRHPNDDDAFFRRGIANLYSGALPQALSDMARAAELDPAYPYYALWLDILSRRNHRPSQLAHTLSKVDMSKWPAPVIHLFLGEQSSTGVLAAARNSDDKDKEGRLCEANFYIGELALGQGANEEATRRFRRAVTHCPRGVEFIERAAAQAELRALGVNS